MSVPQSLTPNEFASRWLGTELADEVCLIDVRERIELEMASLPFAYWIPLAELPSRIGEIDASKTIVVICHSGIRSLRAAQFLMANGYEQVFNLLGGIDAWSQQVDPSVPRY
jgi:rhodanese-related sulfurtransferase